MKTTIIRSGLALGLLLFTMPAMADPQVYTLHVDGLACPFCAYGIEKQLAAIDAVESLEVDIVRGVVIVIAAEAATIDEADLQQAVNDAGFTLREVEQVEIDPRGMNDGDG